MQTNLVSIKKSFSSCNIERQLIRIDQCQDALHPRHLISVIAQELLEDVRAIQFGFAVGRFLSQLCPVLGEVFRFLLDGLCRVRMVLA